MSSNGYVPPIGGAKRGSSVDKFLQYKRRFQETVAQHHTSSPTWFADYLKSTNSGFNAPSNANTLGTTNK